jgi:DNA-binding transcriptional ArsR family regulator
MIYHARMKPHKPPVVSVLAPTRRFAVDVIDGTALELLVALRALSSPERASTWIPSAPGGCPAATRDAVEAIGDPTGDVWLHLLGLALEKGAGDAAAFVGEVNRTTPIDLRRHLLGLHVPSWRRAAGRATIERAASGDADACDQLAAAWREYRDDGHGALPAILKLSPADTKKLIIAALERFATDVLAPHQERLSRTLHSDAEARRHELATADPRDVIERATGGYQYEHEDSFNRVILFPHLAHAPAILLCEHRDARLIGYAAASPDPDPAEVLLGLGRAIGDPSRVAILARLRDGEASLGDLARSLGLAKSTIHHHVLQLRAARLITVRGNTQGTYYALHPDGFAHAAELLDRYIAE